MSPHIFKGASNSRRIGWERNISLDLRQRPRTSDSANWTVLPGRVPDRTVKTNIQVTLTGAVKNKKNCLTWKKKEEKCKRQRLLSGQ